MANANWLDRIIFGEDGVDGVELSDATPAAVGTAAAGVDTEASRSDHVHAHGNQVAGGSMHTAATSSIAGFMSALQAAAYTAIAGVTTIVGTTKTLIRGATSGTPQGGLEITPGADNEPAVVRGVKADGTTTKGLAHELGPAGPDEQTPWSFLTSGGVKILAFRRNRVTVGETVLNELEISQGDTVTTTDHVTITGTAFNVQPEGNVEFNGKERLVMSCGDGWSADFLEFDGAGTHHEVIRGFNRWEGPASWGVAETVPSFTFGYGDTEGEAGSPRWKVDADCLALGDDSERVYAGVPTVITTATIATLKATPVLADGTYRARCTVVVVNETLDLSATYTRHSNFKVVAGVSSEFGTPSSGEGDAVEAGAGVTSITFDHLAGVLRARLTSSGTDTLEAVAHIWVEPLATMAANASLRNYLIGLGAKSVFDARQLPYEGVGDPCEDTDAVELWTRVSNGGEATLDTVGAGTPQYDAADAGGFPCLTFTAANTDIMIGQGTDDLEESGDYSIVIVFSKTADGAVAGWSDASGATRSRAHLIVDATTARFTLESDAGGDMGPVDTVTLGTTRHVAIMEYVGTTQYLTIDGRTQVSSAFTGTGTMTLDQVVAGAAKVLGAYYNQFDGNLYLMGRIARGLTAPERAEIYTRAQAASPLGWGVT